MFALYASLSRLTSVRRDSGRFDSFVMVMFSPWYAGSQRVLRGLGCKFAAIGPAVSLRSSGVGSGLGAGASFACGCAGIDGSLMAFVLSPKLIGSSRLKIAVAVAVRKFSVAHDRVWGACA